MSNVINIDTKDIGELKGLLASARLTGQRRAILSIPVRLFAIDAAYQVQIRTQRDMNYLINNWDETKLMPLIGVPHDEEGKMYIVDGYGRWQASQIVDEEKYQTLEVLVVLDAPTEPKARQKYEAEQYAFQNKQVAQMKPIQKHGALEILEDPAILAMDEMQKKYGFSYSREKGQREGGVIGSYSEMYSITRVYGKDCLDYICAVCKASGFDRKSNGYSSFIMRGLRDAWKYYPEQRKETKAFLSTYLRKFDPTRFKANAISRYLLLDAKMAVSLYLEDLIVDNLATKHKRRVEGKSVTEIKTA